MAQSSTERVLSEVAKLGRTVETTKQVFAQTQAKGGK